MLKLIFEISRYNLEKWKEESIDFRIFNPIKEIYNSRLFEKEHSQNKEKYKCNFIENLAEIVSFQPDVIIDVAIKIFFFFVLRLYLKKIYFDKAQLWVNTCAKIIYL